MSFQINFKMTKSRSNDGSSPAVNTGVVAKEAALCMEDELLKEVRWRLILLPRYPLCLSCCQRGGGASLQYSHCISSNVYLYIYTLYKFIVYICFSNLDDFIIRLRKMDLRSCECNEPSLEVY